METKDQALVLANLDHDPLLKQLWKEHQEFEQKLSKIERKPFLTSDEKVEKKRLQLAKLAGKTQIEAILSKYRHLN